MKRLALAFAAICSVCALQSPAAAQSQSDREPFKIPVATRDIDFNDARSVAAFDQRLARAAKTACDSGATFDLAIKIQDAECAHAAWEQAVKSMDQPLLSALHHQTTSLAQASMVERK